MAFRWKVTFPEHDLLNSKVSGGVLFMVTGAILTVRYVATGLSMIARPNSLRLLNAFSSVCGFCPAVKKTLVLMTASTVHSKPEYPEYDLSHHSGLMELEIAPTCEVACPSCT